MDEDFSDAPPTTMIRAEFSSVPRISPHTQWFRMMSEKTPKRVWQALQSPKLEWFTSVSSNFISQTAQSNPNIQKKTLWTSNLQQSHSNQQKDTDLLHMDPTTWFFVSNPKQWIVKSPEEAERNNKLGHNSTPKVTMSMPPSGAHGNGVFSKKNRTHPGFHHRFGEIQMGEKNCWVYIMVMYLWCVCWLLCLKQNDGHGRKIF